MGVFENVYEKIFRAMENEYHWTKKVLEACINGEYFRLEVLKVWLEMLKTEEEELKEQIGKMEREFSEKFCEAERREYARVKELYVEKMDGVKRELEKLQEKGDEEVWDLISQMRGILDKIWEERIRVAELSAYSGKSNG